MRAAPVTGRPRPQHRLAHRTAAPPHHRTAANAANAYLKGTLLLAALPKRFRGRFARSSVASRPPFDSDYDNVRSNYDALYLYVVSSLLNSCYDSLFLFYFFFPT